MKVNNTITKDEIVNKYKDYLTVEELQKFIFKHNVPYTAKVLVQRVEDRYFDGNDISGCGGCNTTEDGIFPEGSKADGWGVYLKKGEFYYDTIRRNKDMQEEIERRANGEEPEYDLIDDPNDFIQEPTDEIMEQYVPVFCCVQYDDDQDILFLNLHY